MKHSYFIKLIVIICLLSHHFVIGQDALIKKMGDSCTDKYRLDYELVKKEIISFPRTGDNIATAKFQNNSIKTAVSFFFTSKKVYASNTKLRFAVTVFQYASDSAGASKFSELQKAAQAQDESFWNKEWNWVIQHNNYILRLKAGCLYSEAQWEQLKTTFLSALGSITNTSPYSIHCKCGGFCKLSTDNNVNNLLDQVGKQQFSVFYNVEAIPAGLTRYLKEKEGYSLQMLAPGEGYNKSDLVIKGFPDKRLIFGANGSLGVNLLVYQFRSSALPFCLVYKRLSKKAYRLLFLRLFSDIQDIKPLLHAIQTKQYMLR